MYIIFKHIMRNIKMNKLRSLLIIISLAMSAFILYSNLSISGSISDKFEKSLRDTYKEFDIKISATEENDSKTFTINDIDLRSINYNQIMFSRVTPAWYVNTGEEAEKLKVDFIQIDRGRLIENGILTLIENSDSWNPSNTNQIIISERVAKENNLNVNDSINIIFNNKILKYSIGAIAKNANILSKEPTSMMFIFAEDGTLGKSEIGSKDTMFLDIGKSDIQSTLDKLKETNQAYDIHSLIDYAGVNASIANTKNILMIILLVIIVINFFIIVSLIKLILAVRIPVIGTFRSCGATNTKVSLILLFENVMYGFLGGILGIILGILLNSTIIQMLTGYSDISTDVNLKNIIITIMFSVGIQIAIVFISILRLRKIAIIDCIFDKSNNTVFYKKRTFIIGIELIILSLFLLFINKQYRLDLSVISLFLAIFGGFFCIPMLSKKIANLFMSFIKDGPVKMGIKNMISSQSTLSNIKLVTIVLSVLLMIYSLALSLTNFFDNALSTTLKADYIVTNISKEAESYSLLKDNEYINKIEYAYNKFGVTKINGVDYSLLQIVGMDRANFGVEDKNEFLPELNDNEILMDQIFAAKYGFKIGDKLAIHSEFFKNDTCEFILKGFVDVGDFNLNRRVLLINMNGYKQKVTNIPAMMLLHTTEKSEKIFYSLNQQFLKEDLVISDTKEYVGSQKDQVSQILLLVYFMLGLSIALAIVGIINNQIIGFIKRQREYGVLLSVAMSKKQVKTMIVAEVISSFIVSCILGTGLGILLYTLMKPLLFAVNFALDSQIYLTHLIVFVVIVFVLLGLTSCIPILNLNKLDIVKQIKYE